MLEGRRWDLRIKGLHRLLLVLAFSHIATSPPFLFHVGNFCSSAIAVCLHATLDGFF